MPLQARSNNKAYSPACRPRLPTTEDGPRVPIRRIYFSHTRKAGGTTIRQLLKAVAAKYDLELIANEATRQEEPGSRNDTLYMVNLREPVARALSQYKYDVRWNCKNMTNTRLPGTKWGKNASNTSFTYDNEFTLEQFLEKDQEQMRNNRLWVCSHSCYQRWYGQDYNCIGSGRTYMSTLERLMKYHLIVITEKLHDPQYWEGLTGMFNVSISSKGKMPWCDKESKYWNKLYPAVLPNETVHKLRERNRDDISLYHELCDCPGNTIVFPKFDPALFGVTR